MTTLRLHRAWLALAILATTTLTTRGASADQAGGLPQLRADVRALQVVVQAMSAELTATRAQLATTQADLTATQATLHATRADLAATQDALASTQTELATTQLDVSVIRDATTDLGAALAAATQDWDQRFFELAVDLNEAWNAVQAIGETLGLTGTRSSQASLSWLASQLAGTSRDAELLDVIAGDVLVSGQEALDVLDLFIAIQSDFAAAGTDPLIASVGASDEWATALAEMQAVLDAQTAIVQGGGSIAPTSLLASFLASVADATAAVDAALSGSSGPIVDMLLLQQQTQQESRLLTTLSNLMKQVTDTQSSIVSNLK